MCPNSHINTQFTHLWQQHRCVFSHANGHKGAECHPVIDCPKHLANSDQMKHTCHSKGCPNSHVNTQCTPSGGNACIYSHMQMVVKIPKCHATIGYIVPSILHSSQFGNACGRFWRKSKLPLHHVPYVFNWWEIWSSCWSGQLLYTTKITLRCSSRMWTCIYLLKKYIIFLSKKWQ